ncbi:MAG: hypothetical protein JWL96_2975 [Sphingomonas bacterium]|uniref:hypothetical protein n=1 Tax=Sphingomonas bacterium TaxID=1895847 RepID=UPI0026292C1E|nr:hypothetical protein [Sphingomonas bacterium]MDB5710905.1 hypothetical protein [Sphingomonas bacterium]
MHAFDYLVTFFSFVYAIAIAHILATIGDMVVASRRLRFSWLNAGWMLIILLAVIAWWLGLWDLRRQRVWPTVTIAFFFCAACGLYLLARIASPHIPATDEVDLPAFHRREGPKYMIGFGAFSLFTIATNTWFGLESGATSSSGSWFAQNAAVIPMMLASLLAGFVPDRRVQIGCILVIFAMWGWYFATLQGALTG